MPKLIWIIETLERYIKECENVETDDDYEVDYLNYEIQKAKDLLKELYRTMGYKEKNYNIYHLAEVSEKTDRMKRFLKNPDLRNILITQSMENKDKIEEYLNTDIESLIDDQTDYNKIKEDLIYEISINFKIKDIEYEEFYHSIPYILLYYKRKNETEGKPTTRVRIRK